MNVNALLFRVGKSTLTWLTTNALGTVIVSLIVPALTVNHLIMGITFTLSFSSPVVILLIPISIGLARVSSPRWLIVYALLAIFALCVAVIILFLIANGFPFRSVTLLIPLIAPYFIAAQICFFAFYKSIWISLLAKTQQ